MFRNGFKQKILLSSIGLLIFSLLIFSLIFIHYQKQTLTQQMILSSQTQAQDKAALIQSVLTDKITAIKNVAALYAPQAPAIDNIEMTKILAESMNVNGVVIAYRSGEAFWNRTSANYPNHQYKGNVNELAWFREGQAGSGLTISSPYLGVGSEVFWLGIVGKTAWGSISAHPQLAFLNDVVAAPQVGQTVFVLTQDDKILSTSDSNYALNSVLTDHAWYQNITTSTTETDLLLRSVETEKGKQFIFTESIKVGDASWQYLVLIEEKVAFAALNKAIEQALCMLLLMSVIGGLLMYVILQRAYRPILVLKKTIVGLSQGNGDLTQKLEVNSEDDLGQIADGVNRFIAQLHQMMLDIKSVTDKLNHNVTSLVAQSQQSNQVLTEHKSQTEQVVTAVEQMHLAARSVSVDTTNTFQVTSQAQQATITLNQNMAVAKEDVGYLVTDVSVAATHVQQMNQQINDINHILTVIGDIAEQTNLLALNAAIEAARVGDLGRGFAVVADEVRSLANRTKSSTDQISLALLALTDGGAAIMQSMQQTEIRCGETEKSAGTVAVGLVSIGEYVNEINALSEQIAASSEEQSVVTSEVSRNMNQINEMVQKLDLVGQETDLEVKKIAQENHQLLSILNRFKLD